MGHRSRAQRMAQAREILGALSYAEVSGGTTSPPSPSPQPGVPATELMTGAEDQYRAGRWLRGVEVQHLCYPPQSYPQEAGPGTQWRCACGAVWEGRGIAIHQYPLGSGFRRNDAILAPEYWLWVEGTGSDTSERYLAQQAMWDWRSAADKIAELLQRQFGRL